MISKSFTPASAVLNTALFFLLVFYVMPSIILGKAYGQAVVAPWGNITGIRVNGQLMEFESSLTVVGKDWSGINSTGRERQKPKYAREGNKQIITTSLDSVGFTETVEDAADGIANVDVQLVSASAKMIEGAFFCMALPFYDYSKGSLQLPVTKKSSAPKVIPVVQAVDQRFTVNTIRFVGLRRQLQLDFDGPTLVIIKAVTGKAGDVINVYFPIQQGDVQNGTIARKTFKIKASGYIDKRKITLTLDTANVGRAFEGLGGNFRLQNPKADPQVIDYCLQNMRVAWGRVEMPWNLWQPEKNIDPAEAAKAGKLHPKVQKAMEMAQRLSKMGIPVILSAWFPPQWAIVGQANLRPDHGIWGNPLETANMPAIYESIAAYILYLRNNYGVQVALFSFNESDLGIDIRQTGQEHAALIKGLGAYFVARGLATKMLLGDNSDATTYKFIYPAMQDAEARNYIGAVSFHSWRGWQKETLLKWANAAKQLNIPLIVGEGSIDAAAWNYPAVFEEQTFALEEINLYTRLLAICQPLSILQWQLTADYSPLAGGGIFGNSEPLYPTQRFWNLKQLASTPKGLFAMPLTGNMPDVSCAGLGNNITHVYTMHLVDNGTGRQVTVSGIPKKVKSFLLFTTDKKRAMEQSARLTVSNGQIHFNLDATSFTTLISE